MPAPVLRLIAFTLVPLVALLFGIGLSVWYRYVLRERRLLLAGLLFALMAAHQGIELVQWTRGGNPHLGPLAEGFETTVNLLAVAAIAYIAGSLTDERRLATILAETHQLPGDRDPDDETDPSPTASTPGGHARNLPARIAGLVDARAAETSPRTFGRRSRLDDVLDRAVETVQIRYPIATFDVRSSKATEVIADDVYLQEILEIILEQLVAFNDASDPVVTATVERENGTVAVTFSHNGTGFPREIERIVTEREDIDPEFAELVFVERFVSRWGGSMHVAVDDVPTLTVRFERPRFSDLLG
ncbi:MAG: hypothetical protein ABEJ44_00580 [Halanaeroarchaeum sp.]